VTRQPYKYDPNEPEKKASEPKVPLTTEPCIEGRARHSYMADGKCRYCGYESKVAARFTQSSTPSSTPRPRPTSTTGSRTTPVQPAVSMKDAREGMAFVLLLAQKILVMRVPDFKPDELSPIERQLLAEALTEELYESNQVRRFLATLNKQKKHAKLSMALMIILLPRLKRHGIIPDEMDLEEITGELVQQAVSQSTSTTTSGHGGDSTTGSEPSWDSVPVAAGGSSIPDRGNRFGKINVGGVVNETASIRSDSEDEGGRDSVAGPSYRPVPLGDEKPTSRPHRVATGSETGGSEAS
jgi:hypothetical protein